LLQAGKPAEAERVFQEDLKKNARNPRSMFGLAESLKAQGRTAEARTAEQQFKIAGEMPIQNWRYRICKRTVFLPLAVFFQLADAPR